MEENAAATSPRRPEQQSGQMWDTMVHWGCGGGSGEKLGQLGTILAILKFLGVI